MDAGMRRVVHERIDRGASRRALLVKSDWIKHRTVKKCKYQSWQIRKIRKGTIMHAGVIRDRYRVIYSFPSQLSTTYSKQLQITLHWLFREKIYPPGDVIRLKRETFAVTNNVTRSNVKQKKYQENTKGKCNTSRAKLDAFKFPSFSDRTKSLARDYTRNY